MSSLLEIYQSSTKTVSLFFADDGGTGVNVSGSLLYYTAKRNYSDSTSDAVLNKVITGNASSVSGMMSMTFTTGETSLCVNDYYAGWTLLDPSGNVSPFDTDGLRILPSPMGYAP